MPTATRRLVPLALAAVLVATGIVACGATGPGASAPVTPSAAATAASTAPVDATASATFQPPTPVPGGTSPSPDDSYGGGPTTVTDWGTILDRAPEDFPRYPGSAGIDPFDGPASAAWETADDVEKVAAWYVSAFEELGWSRVDLGSPLEDGTQVLDLGTDLPECRVQVTFRPAGGSTMIIVMYGAGCAGGDG